MNVISFENATFEKLLPLVTSGINYLVFKIATA